MFYNYGPGTGIPGRGKAFMDQEPYYYYTNLPNGYLDTRFGDDPGEKSYAVGTKDVRNLSSSRTYYFIMKARWYPTDNDTNGLWQINLQRGYWFDSQNPYYRLIRGSGDEWYIFNEEYEVTAKIKRAVQI